MKKITRSIVPVLAISIFANAGGNIKTAESTTEISTSTINNFYIGVGYSMVNSHNNFTDHFDDVIDYVDDFGVSGADYKALMLQAGYTFNQYISLEGRYWKSGTTNFKHNGYYTDAIDTNEPYSNSGSYGDKMKAWGIYVKPTLPITNKLGIYTLLGYGNITLSDDSETYHNKNGFQWGAGTSYAVTDNLSVFIDYVSLYNDETSYDTSAVDYWSGTDDRKIHTVNLGVTYKF